MKTYIKNLKVKWPVVAVWAALAFVAGIIVSNIIGS